MDMENMDLGAMLEEAVAKIKEFFDMLVNFINELKAAAKDEMPWEDDKWA